jgi:hypothetical protein
MIPWNCKGAFFSGLNQQHTGLLRVRYVVERFPSPDEADISLTAQPCAKYCPEYFQVKSVMLREMPVAMPVSSNGLGTWLSSALSWVFPGIRRGLHAMTAPDPEPTSRETKEIVKLAKSVEKMANTRAIVNKNGNATQRPPKVQTGGPTKKQANRRKRNKKPAAKAAPK